MQSCGRLGGSVLSLVCYSVIISYSHPGIKIHQDHSLPTIQPKTFHWMGINIFNVKRYNQVGLYECRKKVFQYNSSISERSKKLGCPSAELWEHFSLMIKFKRFAGLHGNRKETHRLFRLYLAQKGRE